MVNSADQQMEHQIQQAVETFNSMDHHQGGSGGGVLDMQQFIDQGNESHSMLSGHLGESLSAEKGSSSSANNTMNFINENMDTFVDMSGGGGGGGVGHMFVNGSSNNNDATNNDNKMVVGGVGGNTGNFSANDYSFNFDPFDTNVLFSTNLNDLEV
jgi:hypothetical protein